MASILRNFLMIAGLLTSVVDSRSVRKHRYFDFGNEVKRFKFKDCGKSNRVVQINGLDILPFPIEIPGRLTIKIHANVTEELPRKLIMRMNLKKLEFGNFWLKIPCFKQWGWGSCGYREDICEMFDSPEVPCPVRPGPYSVKQDFYLPNIEPMYRSLLQGSYKVVFRAVDPGSRRELACVRTRFRIIA